jgi:hypothetical protein
MQTENPNTRTPGAVNHPSAAEWMAFLYEEVAPQQKRELQAHLAQCAACAEQVKGWRAGMTALNEWPLPIVRRAPHRWQPMVKWAAAAAVVLGVGFFMGRQTTTTASEFAALKTSVAQLTETVKRDRHLNTMNAAATANAEVLRLLAEYARLDEDGRAEDRKTVALALQEFESRLARLRAELETVAVNTEDGFQQTQEGLTRLVSLNAADETKSNRTP